MNVLYLEWNCYCGKHVINEMRRRCWNIEYFDLFKSGEDTRYSAKLTEMIAREAILKKANIIFSMNYFPVAAIAAKTLGIRYVSWTYDSPSIQLYSNTIGLASNIAFIFDYSEYLELKNKGVESVYYLPLAGHVDCSDLSNTSADDVARFSADISMVGSMYSESKHRLSRHLLGVDEYTKGYLEAVKKAQIGVYGIDLIRRTLTNEIVNNIQKVCPIFEKEDGIEDIDWVISKYFLCRDITAIERRKSLELLSKVGKVKLYTNDITMNLANVCNMGQVDYYKEMPKVFRLSKINLNVTLKSIDTGIPLRAFDVMANGGFLLTNYQADFKRFFVCGEDYVIYEDWRDLVKKAEYFLEHDEEREKIAQSGYDKVKKYHTYHQRFDTIISVMQSQGVVV